MNFIGKNIALPLVKYAGLPFAGLRLLPDLISYGTSKASSAVYYGVSRIVPLPLSDSSIVIPYFSDKMNEGVNKVIEYITPQLSEELAQNAKEKVEDFGTIAANATDNFIKGAEKKVGQVLDSAGDVTGNALGRLGGGGVKGFTESMGEFATERMGAAGKKFDELLKPIFGEEELNSTEYVDITQLITRKILKGVQPIVAEASRFLSEQAWTILAVSGGTAAVAGVGYLAYRTHQKGELTLKERAIKALDAGKELVDLSVEQVRNIQLKPWQKKALIVSGAAIVALGITLWATRGPSESAGFFFDKTPVAPMPPTVQPVESKPEASPVLKTPVTQPSQPQPSLDDCPKPLRTGKWNQIKENKLFGETFNCHFNTIKALGSLPKLVTTCEGTLQEDLAKTINLNPRLDQATSILEGRVRNELKGNDYNICYNITELGRQYLGMEMNFFKRSTQ